MEEPPDFVRIDKLVQEYLTYRQSAPSAGDKLSPDDIVEKMMKYFDTGDYPNILYLWDTYVSERLDTADAHVVHEAGVAEFYMHIHCATCPFRQSSIRDMPNPGAAGKVAARAMTIFKHFVDTKGKSLAATPEFHAYKPLSKIAFPPTHPKYQHLFYTEWINRTRESYFKFLIPFLRDTEYPALCYELSNQNKSESSMKSPDELLKHAKDKEKRTHKLARDIFEAASDFVDMIGDGGMASPDSIEEIQTKLKELGKAIMPHSPGVSHNHSSPLDGMLSIAGDVESTAGRKKKKLRKKKPNYDFALIGVDLSSMIVEISTEISKHLQEDLNAGTSSLSVDLEMATQSALQGCLLIKALRHLLSFEEQTQKVDPPPSIDTVHENSEPPSPRSKGGSIDKIVLSMTQGDLFGVVGAENSSAEEAGSVAEKSALPFEALLNVCTRAAEHIRNLPVVEEPGEDGAVVDREEKMLNDTMSVSRYFVEDYISMIALVCTSESGTHYVVNSDSGIGLYSRIIQYLLELKPDKKDMMVKLHVVCLCTILSIGHKSSPCLAVFIRKGGIPWLASTLDRLFGLNEEVAKSLPGHEDYVDLCMGLLHLIVREPSCRQLLFQDSDLMASLTSISRQLVNVITAQTSKLKDGKKANRSSATPPEGVLYYFLENETLRSTLRAGSEVASLKVLVADMSQDETLAVRLETVKSIIKNIDSTEFDRSVVGASVSDLVYSVGVRNLVGDMLGSLEDSDEVLKYRDENPSYSTNNHILEKYKQSVVFSPN